MRTWLLAAAVLVGTICAGGASATPTNDHTKLGRTWVWRGAVVMDAQVEAADGFGNTVRFRYRFNNVYPGKWVKGFNRSQWNGILTWDFQGYVNEGGLACTFKGSGRFHTRTQTFIGAEEGGSPRLNVVVFPHDVPRDGPTTGKVVRDCGIYGAEVEEGRNAFRFLPVITSIVLKFRPQTRSISRTVRTPARWEWGSTLSPDLKVPVRISFKRVK